jgi:KaiC/GvpD/RAD55 family RecA-like ATPase
MNEKDLPIFRKDRISTGVDALDIMLEGGYRYPGAALLMAPTGSEKQCFAAHFAKAGLSADDAIIYVTTDKTPAEVEKAAAGWDLHFKGPGQIFYIDCYTQGEASGKANIYKVGGPGALNEISLYISEILRNNEGKRFRLVFHTFSTFALYNEMGSLFKFLDSVKGRVKSAGGTILLLVEEGMHEERFLTTLRHTIDEEYDLRNKDKIKEFISSRLPIAVPLKVGPLGIEVD